MKKFVIGATLLGLAACGGGESRFTEYFNAIDDLSTDPRYAYIDYTPTASIPVSGSAAYNGYAFAETAGGTFLLGEASMMAEFSTNSVDGVIRNVVDDTDQAYSGQVNIAATIDRTADPEFDYQINGFAIGSLSALGETYDISGTGAGDFYGPDYRGIGFEIDGIVEDGASTEDIFIGIIAVK